MSPPRRRPGSAGAPPRARRDSERGDGANPRAGSSAPDGDTSGSRRQAKISGSRATSIASAATSAFESANVSLPARARCSRRIPASFAGSPRMPESAPSPLARSLPDDDDQRKREHRHREAGVPGRRRIAPRRVETAPQMPRHVDRRRAGEQRGERGTVGDEPREKRVPQLAIEGIHALRRCRPQRALRQRVKPACGRRCRSDVAETRGDRVSRGACRARLHAAQRQNGPCASDAVPKSARQMPTAAKPASNAAAG